MKKYYISNIAMSEFRLIHSIKFQPVRFINLLVGKNGTGKSTILGMIAQGLSFNSQNIFGLTNKNDYSPLLKKDILTDEEQKNKTNYELTGYILINFLSQM